eukprot:m.245640 g.245640  ORF g.245640 m.245640 type:complete len:363 (+) comp38174_c0_seq1:76-1164(+)
MVNDMELQFGVHVFEHVDRQGRSIPVHYYLSPDFPAHCQASTPFPGSAPVTIPLENEPEIEVLLDRLCCGTAATSDVEKPAIVQSSSAHVTPSPGLAAAAAQTLAHELQEVQTDVSDVIFVMHGLQRDARSCCAVWSKIAREHRLLVVCPEFNAENFPDFEEYTLGGVEEGRECALWTFSVIEDIFDALLAGGLARTCYSLYGHSAGAQFAHRFALFMPPTARVVRIVAANAGWYTLPHRRPYPFRYPYSLRRAPHTSGRQIRHALQRHVGVLLGEEDLCDEQLRKTPGAMAQGPTRLARGQLFHAAAVQVARERGVTLGWRLQTVPGARHDHRDMARAAAAMLLDPTAFADSALQGGEVDE